MSTKTYYVEPGTLARPGPIGRGVRLVFALACFYAVAQVIVHGEHLLEPTPPTGWVMPIAIALLVFPYVVNLGWGRSWGRWPQVANIVAILLAVVTTFVLSGRLWGVVPGTLVAVWLLYTFGHLGMSFLVAAVIATPGCEMRALPHLWTLRTGRSTAEHHCPGPLDGIDRWETGLGGRHDQPGR